MTLSKKASRDNLLTQCCDLRTFIDMKKDYTPPIKVGICVLALFLCMAFFAYVCREVVNDYLMVLIPNAKTILWLIRLCVATLLLSTAIGIVAVLVRPVWIAMIAYVVAAIIYALITDGGSVTTLIVALVFSIFSLTYLRFVFRQLENQVNFSTHPLSDMKFLLFSLLALLVTVTFGLGYSVDAARRSYVIPPEIRAPTLDFVMSQAKTTVDKQKISAAQKKEALASTRNKIESTLNDLEKQAQPTKKWIPIIIDVTLFFIVQIVFILLGFISLVVLQLVFFLLKLTHFAHLNVEKREIKHLTIA